ncbi:MAG TPA: hypothetical protein VKA15_15400 [Isosphaeraceae bacterium]|nr:hypothetical protein [Isosphaeraceae bacterium]
MKFKDAVVETKGLTHAYPPGLRSLREVDRKRIKCKNPRSLRGSVDLDEALKDANPDDPRWDYGIGVEVNGGTDRAIWIEIHPASHHHINEVLKKHRWLKGWLTSSAPLLNQMDAEFVWIASGKVSIPPNSPLRRKIDAQGIRFAGQWLRL